MDDRLRWQRAAAFLTWVREFDMHVAQLSILVILSAAACGAQSGPLTLDDCIRLAQNAPSGVRVAMAETEVAKQGVSLAKANFAPFFRLATGYTYNSDAVFVALNGVHEYVTQALATQEIDTSGRLRAGLARAKADQAIAQTNLTVVQRDLKRAVTAAYYRLLLSRHLITASRDSLNEASGFFKRSQALVQGGEAARADLAKADAQVAFLDQVLNTAELEGQLANQDLASFWTADTVTPLQIVDVFEIEVPKPENLPGSGPAPFLRRPEFRVFDAQRAGFLADARRARSDLYPQTSFMYQYGIDANAYSFANRGQAAFVALNVPIFDFFRARNSARQFQIRAQTVDMTRQVAERLFSRDYQNALSRVRMIFDQIGMTKRQVSASDENYRLARVRYEGGEGLALDVVVAQAQLAQARSNYFAALAAYLNARADLEVAAGQ